MKKFIIIFVAVVIFIGVGVYYLSINTSTIKPAPNEARDSIWLTYSDKARNITFRYPEKLSTKYIGALDWPPQIQVLNEPFTCIGAGSETARAGKTERRLVDDREYCRTSIVEGAAGSIYTQYAYSFLRGNSTIIFTFSTRATQCANYDEVERKDCEGERETFDLDSVIDKIVQTVQI